MTIAKNAKPSKQKTAITVALAAAALAAAGTAAPGGETPTTATPKPDSSIAPASAVLAAIATPNSLYAAGGAAQVAVLRQGSGGIPAVGAAPKVGAAGPNLFAPKFFAHPAAAPTGAGPAWSAGSFTHAALISASPGGGGSASAAPLFTSSAPAVFAVSSPALIQVNPVGASVHQLRCRYRHAWTTRRARGGRRWRGRRQPRRPGCGRRRRHWWSWRRRRLRGHRRHRDAWGSRRPGRSRLRQATN